MRTEQRVAYFSMEIGVDADIPTYSGGLGVLAGDTIRAAADLSVPMIAVTLLHRKGYCRQLLDAAGNQTEEPIEWKIEDHLTRLPEKVSVRIEGRDVIVGAWTRDVNGFGGYKVPVLFLDTDLPENDDNHRGLTHHLYGGDERYRLCQEAVLGIGGVRMLRLLRFDGLTRFHMNEGHASLLACELLNEMRALRPGGEITPEDALAVRKRCVFTTHTPVPAGHDQFPREVVDAVLDESLVSMLEQLACLDGRLNMTHLALHLSQYVNGVARSHGAVSRKMYAAHQIDSITNGVHARTWVCDPLQAVFDKHMPTWQEDSFGLRNALSIPNHVLWDAHVQAKQTFISYVNDQTGADMEVEPFTIGFARRAAAYKRADLFFQDLDRLRQIHEKAGPLQVIYAGKAHPQDTLGKDMIRRVVQAMEQLGDDIKLVYLPDYDMKLCKIMTAGVDVWLNTPKPPMEASGTSGMKAALNGVPSLSVLDGWWVEGWIEGTTGWAIDEPGVESDDQADAQTLYDKLEYVILPLYYQNREHYIDVMRYCIALNGSFFNTQRMVHQYVVKAYFL